MAAGRGGSEPVGKPVLVRAAESRLGIDGGRSGSPESDAITSTVETRRGGGTAASL
jgi:hypothetical protein